MKPNEIYCRWLGSQHAPDADSDMRAHLERLHDAAHGTVVELGLDRGVSTSALLAGVEKQGGTVTSIDINGGCTGIALFNGHPQWRFVLGRSLNVDMPDEIDVLLIDSSHEYSDTLHELRKWGSRVKRDGVMFLHDVMNPLYPGVRRSIDDYMAGNPSATLKIHEGSFGMAEIRFK